MLDHLPALSVEVNFQATDSDALIFGDATRGKFGTGTFGGALEWVDVTAYVRAGEVTRGSSRFEGVIARAEPGKARVVLDNRDARFDPTNLAGPYVSAGESQIQPMRAWRIRADGFDLWRGFADAWTLDYPLGGKDAICTLTGTDATKVLANDDRPGLAEPGVGAGETTGARIARILDNAEWPAVDRDLDVGQSTVQRTLLAQPAWTEILLTADTEAGEVWINGAGKVVFRNRHALLTEARSIEPQAVFGDGEDFAEGFAYPDGPVTAHPAWDPVVIFGGDVPLEVAAGQLRGGTGSRSAMTAGAWGDGVYSVKIAALGLVGWYFGLNPATLDYLAVYVDDDGSDAWLARSDLGVETVLDSAVAVGVDPGDTLTFERAGDEIEVRLNGAPLLAATDPAHRQGRVGVWSNDPNLRLDDLAIANVELGYVGLALAHDDDQIANLVRIARVGGTEQVAEDVPSQVRYLTKTFLRSDLIHETDADSAEYAGYVLSILKDADLRFDGLALDPRGDPARLYPQALGRELGDRIRVLRRPPGREGDPVARDCVIRGIAHAFTADSWAAGWALQDASRLAFLILDHATLGRLDFNRLAF